MPNRLRANTLLVDEVDLGSGVKIAVDKTPKKAYIYNNKGTFPNALPEKTEFESDGIKMTAHRTAVYMEHLADIVDEFPDSIKETISRLLDC